MNKKELSAGGGSAAGEKLRRRRAAALAQPPSTLPIPTPRELPDTGGGAQTGETDPGIPAVRRPVRSGGGSSSGSSGARQRPDLDFHMPEEDAEARLRYENALAELERLRGEAPQYDNRYDEQIRSLYEQIASRSPFRYDSASDPLYQQYRQDYTALGRMAMRDTMGQTADLTGGYGSSYAQSASQQQYDAYLRRLADVLPETYGMALDAWNAEGDELHKRYDAVSSLEKGEYERYLDTLGQYNRTLDRARSDADTAYERRVEQEERDYRRAVDDYERRNADYDRALRRRRAASRR